MSSPLIVIAAGGTGGHMFPAQALAEAMIARGWRVRLSTDARGARFITRFPAEVEITEVASATFSRGGLLSKLATPFKIGAGVLSALISLRRSRPAIVVGFGGYPTIPAMTAARILQVPRMIHEQNAVLGRVNTFFAKHVDAIACGSWPTRLPEGIEGIHTGNPVRANVLARAGAGYIAPGEYPMSILVIGGSQAARILSEHVPRAIGLLPDHLRTLLRVSHQARGADHASVVAAYDAIGVKADVQEFFDDVPARMADAQLIISRAGASSLADISVIGRPSILVPLAIATNDHQSENARGLVDAQATIMIPESMFEAQTLASQIAAILDDPRAAQTMAENALQFGITNATERLVELIEDVANVPASA